MSPSWTIRAFEERDLPFLEQMSLQSFYSGPQETPPPLAEAMKNPLFACWLEGWGRAGDAALVGDDPDGKSAGIAWYRYFSYERRSYGFVHPDVPEVAIGVRENFRGDGLGTVLLRALADHARSCGVERLSLSVDAANVARRLYVREGFREAGVIMLADLALK